MPNTHDLITELPDEEYLAREEEARNKLRERLTKYQQSENKLAPSDFLHIDRVMYEFAKSELTDDNLEQINDEFFEDFGDAIFSQHVPKQFEYVSSGSERRSLFENTMKKNAKTPALPDSATRILNKNVKKALEQLQKYETNRLANGNVRELNEQEVSRQMPLLHGEKDMLEVVITLLRWPQFAYIPNPAPLKLPTPLFPKDAVDIIVFVNSKERKELVRTALKAEPYATTGLKVMPWEKFLTRYRSPETKTKLAQSYDLIFIDPEIKLYQLLDKPFFTKSIVPIVLPTEQNKWVTTIDEYLAGTAVYVPRGVPKIHIPIGYAQTDVSKLNQNVMALMKSVGPYVPNGAHDNILQVGLGVVSQPFSLPVYKNTNAEERRFRMCKQFAKEAKRPRSSNTTTTTTSVATYDDDEDEETAKPSKRRRFEVVAKQQQKKPKKKAAVNNFDDVSEED